MPTFAPLLASFLDRHPSLAVGIELSEHKADLLAGDFDLAIRLGEVAPSSLMSRRLTSFPLVLAASPAYLTASGRPTHPQDLARREALIYAQTASPTR